MGSQDVQLRVKLSFCAGSLLNWVIRMELLILLAGVSVSLPGWKAELSVFCQGPRKATHFPSDVFFLTRIRMVKPLWKLQFHMPECRVFGKGIEGGRKVHLSR